MHLERIVFIRKFAVHAKTTRKRKIVVAVS